MKMIVGLGNPGSGYQKTRHNAGFRALDFLASKINGVSFKKKFNAEYLETSLSGKKLVLLKPMQFMNLSGIAVAKVLSYYKDQLSLQNVLVLYDDIDLKFGQIRLRADGGTGGHNGIKSLFEHCENTAFARLRIGVKGEDPYDDLSDYVLKPFSKDEEENLEAILQQVYNACLCWVEDGIEKAMNIFN